MKIIAGVMLMVFGLFLDVVGVSAAFGAQGDVWRAVTPVAPGELAVTPTLYLVGFDVDVRTGDRYPGRIEGGPFYDVPACSDAQAAKGIQHPHPRENAHVITIYECIAIGKGDVST